MTEQIKIGFLMYPGAQLSAIYGLSDLFSSANRIVLERNLKGAASFSTYRCHLLPDAHIQFSSVLGDEVGDDSPEQLEVVIIPPIFDFDFSADPPSELMTWLRKQHRGGALICSICSAVFLLGASGLLEGRVATTHWGFKDLFQDKFPSVALKIDQMVVDDGDIMTAAGIMAWIDLGLRLIDRYVGSLVMLDVAQFFLVDPSGREQRFYSKFSPNLFHGDEDILRVQHWLQAHYHESFLMRDMAMIAALGERTFLRRFKRATGMRPLEYLQALRVAKAREMLEFSTLSLQDISGKVGYEDSGALRKIFHRLMGLTPSDYRKRFTVRKGA